MIFYNVTVIINKKVETEWLSWMKEIHMPDVMKTGFFNNSKIFKIVLPAHAVEEVSFLIQYECESLEQYIGYSENHAPKLQQEHTEKFSGMFTASRMVLEEI
jgi:hypothetical protein